MQSERIGWFVSYDNRGEGKSEEVCVKFDENRHILELDMDSETDFNMERIEVPIGDGHIGIKEGWIYFPEIITMEEAQNRCSDNERLMIHVEYNDPPSSETFWGTKERWDTEPISGGKLTGRARLISKDAWLQQVPKLPIAEIIEPREETRIKKRPIGFQA